jgi:hypothetical protein
LRKILLNASKIKVLAYGKCLFIFSYLSNNDKVWLSTLFDYEIVVVKDLQRLESSLAAYNIVFWSIVFLAVTYDSFFSSLSRNSSEELLNVVLARFRGNSSILSISVL